MPAPARPLPAPSHERRVVVTGLGAVGPCGNDVPSTWRSMIDGKSGIGPVTRFDTTGWPCRIAGEVRDLDPDARLGPRALRRLGVFMVYALVAGDEAMADAGYDVAATVAAGAPVGTWPDPLSFGVYVGSGIGGFPEIVEATGLMNREGIRSISPLFIPRSLINLATGQLAIRYHARGPSLCLSTACAVGNHSIGEAWRAIRDGDADVILAGGTEGSLTALSYGGFMNMKALSRRNEEPERASRPFDRDRDGFVMSEGAGVVVLEEYEHARRRDARIYCELRGYAATTDAFHITAPSPGGDGAARCMTRALAIAGLGTGDVDYINAHGTSTPANDAAETQAVHAAFGHDAKRLMMSSTKSVTGHLLGAAGGIEAVATALALHRGVVPQTANLDHPDPECDLDYVPREAREAPLRAALSNGFGFGGTNAVLAFGRI